MNLPRYQITARDVRKGEDITIQTDNGSEFNGIKIHHNRGFKAYLKKEIGVNHMYIPPRNPNANSDVESSYRLIEDEFYKIESIKRRREFLDKAYTYQAYFNLYRKNSYKGRKTPKDIIQEYNLPLEILVLPSVIIDDILYKKQKIKSLFKLRNDCLENNMYHHVPDHSELTEVFTRTFRFSRTF